LLRKLGMEGLRFEREDEKKPGFWEQFSLERVRYVDFMKAALYRFAEQKDCVLVGRGANIIFRGVPGTLRLRLVAPLPVRLERVRERLRVDEPHALRLIHQSDHDRVGYHKYFFNAVWDSLADYDLVVNTAGIPPAAVVETAATLLRSPAFQGAGEAARGVLRDLRIAQDVIIAVAYRERLAVMNLEVVCDKGVVALDGTAQSQVVIDRCARVAESVEGVERVVSNIALVEYPYFPGI
jgi:hypothetical protein